MDPTGLDLQCYHGIQQILESYLQIFATKMLYLQVFATKIMFLKYVTKAQCLALNLSERINQSIAIC